MPSPLLTAATSTFESLALLLAEAPPTAAQAEVPLTHAARVAFTGPRAGTLDVAVSDGVAVALAANMLGLDPGAVRADERLRRDAVGELANVVCGNVLPLVAGREAVFRLGAPSALDPAATPAAGALVEVLGVDEGRVAVTLFLDAPAAPRLLP